MSVQLVLGSSSKYRSALLTRLRIPFITDAPDIDESRLDNENPLDLSLRLALGKARAVAQRHPGAWVIGSDQVAELNGQDFGKPGSHDKAVQMLQTLSGQELHFHTALCLYDSEHKRQQLEVVTVRARYRQLNLAEIDHYLRIDQPYDCAGSARSESLGITLMESIQSDDPTALEGLPLIYLSRMLRHWGVSLPSDAGSVQS
jgi:septum formation protein